MKKPFRYKISICFLVSFLSAASGCSARVNPTETPTPKPTQTGIVAPTVLPTLTPSPVPTEVPTATLSPTVTAAPTQSVRQLDPWIDTNDSISFLNWSPDSSWLAYFNFTDNSLHFYNPVSQKTCAYPDPLKWSVPLGPLRWAGSETAIIQDGSRLLSGLPCSGQYAPPSAADREAFTRTDPSISPDGRYKAETRQPRSSNGLIQLLSGKITDRRSGAIVYQLDYSLPVGGCGCGESLGQWLNNDTLLIGSTADQGPMLVFTNKRGGLIPSWIFNQPESDHRPQIDWRVIGATVAGTSAYHLLLTSTSQPNLMLFYHSETGQIETFAPPTSYLSFSQDGRWLLDSRLSADGHMDVWVRPVDPPGGSWSQMVNGVYSFPIWSPDKQIAMITTAQDQTSFAQYSMVYGRILTYWKNAQYELTPVSWSPDGSLFIAGGRQINNLKHNALFLVQTAPHAPVTLRTPPFSLPYGLSVEEYRLQERPGFAANSDSLEFKPVGTTMQAVLNQHVGDQENTTTMQYYANNLALRPFGYRLATDSWVYGHIPTQAALWKLYHGDTLVLRDISEAGQVFRGASGKDFVMTAQVPNRTVLVQKDSIQDYPFSFQDRVGMIGDDLFEAIDRAGSPAGAIELRRAGRIIQTIPIAFGGALLDFMGLWTTHNHWTIEVLSKLDLNLNNPVGDIYTDGVSLNKKLGYEDSFNFTYLRDQPFFFYKKDGKIGISFAGQEIPLDYNQVLHDGCCSAGAFNPGVSQNMVSFFAERDGAWYYVDVGVFSQ